MFHLSVFEYTPGGTAAFTLQDAPSVPDPAITLNQSGHPVFEQDVELLAAYAFGQTDLSVMQFQTPRLRPIALPQIWPISPATLPPSPNFIADYSNFPLRLNKIDENSVQLSATTGTSGNHYYAGVWFGDGNHNVSQGQVYTIGFTAAITCTANQWTNGVITLAQTLPSGTYAVRGMFIYGTNLAFARLIFPRQQWRPGVVAGQNPGFIQAYCFRKGNFGDYGRFESYAQPQLDCFAINTCTAQTGALDLVKIA